MAAVLELLAEAESVVDRLPALRDAVAGLSDAELMEGQRRLAAIERRTGASAALFASEIAHRSRPDLGYAGLAQRTGARTPESLVQQLTGSTSREAATLVRVGNVMAEAELLPPAPPTEPSPGESTGGATEPVAEISWDGKGTVWLAAVGRAVADGSLPVTAADAIRAGLGTPSDTVTVAALAGAAQTLVAEAGTLNADQLFKRARALRDEIDAEGVAERERQRHQERYLRVHEDRNGVIRGNFAIPAESGGAEIKAAFDAVNAPRRGGPRFVDKDDLERAQRILDDERTPEQANADALVELIRLGVAVDPGKIVGSNKPAVPVLVTGTDLQKATTDTVAGKTPTGIGWLQGHANAVSMGTVQRQVCEAGIVPILFDDDGQAVNVGRNERLFNHRQRMALAARDGGCRWPGCDRPPSWCEAHHLKHWFRDHGRTDLADGILLCRHHHLLVHNNGWEIVRDGGTYWLIPPRERDPSQTPILMPTKSPALTHLQRRQAG